jgi:pyruvate,water dikinase
MAFVIWFDEYRREHRDQLGGKNASLGELASAGLPVPPGFAVVASECRSVLGDPRLAAALAGLVAGIDFDDPAAAEQASRRARDLVDAAPMSAELADEIRTAYQELGRRCETVDVPVAVRSSATCEDSPDASFAGEHDTYLWVRGADAVIANVQRCWSSLFTARALCYRRAMGFAEQAMAMSVGVQKMVTPRSSGVAFTLNPLDGDRSQVAIDAAWGFGEAVVGGEVTPDNFLVDKVIGVVGRRTISNKEIEFRLGPTDRVERVAVDSDRATTPSLTDDEIRAVAALARRAERHYRCPQDIEWAVDDQLPPPNNVVLLQSRPETVWSRKARTPVSRSTGNYLTSMVDTLVAPLAGKTDLRHS